MKFKVKRKDCQLQVKAKTSFGDKVDKKELDRFSRLFLRGFFKPRSIKSKKIEYTGPIGISLRERLKKPISKREFLFIIEQIVVAVQKLQSNDLSIKYMIMDIQRVYINEVTKEMQFIYIPMKSNVKNITVSEFIEEIVYLAKPNDETDNEFVSRFIYYFRALSPFDINKLETFVSKEDKSVVSTIKKQNAGQSGFMTSKQQHYYEHYDNNGDEEATGLLNDEEATGLLDDEETTGLLDEDEATGLLDEEATGLLNEPKTSVTQKIQQEACYAILYRVQTDENIKINKPVFRLGKERSYVDYFVANNLAVSRSHADIITRGGKHLVIDLNSKNHTFVNGIEIPVQVETEIKNGDKLTLADEEFIFKT